MKRTTFNFIFLLALLVARPSLAAEPDPIQPPHGMGRYVMVLRQPGEAAVGEAKPEKGKTFEEPDVTKLGGRVLRSSGNDRILFLPPQAAAKLREHESVMILQRIWVGESEEEWRATTSSSPAGMRMSSDSETNLTWATGTYLYDGSGNIKTIGDDTYQYDQVGRLVSATVKGITETYTYDSFGNLRTKQTGTKPAVTMAIDSTSNRLAQEAYDVAGNVLTNTPASTQYHYDAAGMLALIEPQFSVSRRMIYTADDERIGTLIDSAGEWTIRGFDKKVLTRFRSSTNDWVWEQDYVYADGQLVGGDRELAHGGRRHHHLDHLGSVRMTSSDSRTRYASNDYFPFGIEQTPLTQEDTNFGYGRPETMSSPATSVTSSSDGTTTPASISITCTRGTTTRTGGGSYPSIRGRTGIRSSLSRGTCIRMLGTTR